MSYWNDVVDTINKAKTAEELRNYRRPDAGPIDTALMHQAGINSPYLDKLQAERLDMLLRNEAAPTAAEASRLKIMSAQDPFLQSPEALADFAARPDFWLGSDNTGVVTQGKKPPSTAIGSNPYSAAVIQQFAVDNQTQNDMYAAMNGDRNAAARLAMQEKIPQQFHQAAQGLDQLSNVEKRNQEIANTDKSAADLAQFQRTIAGMNGGTTREQFVGPYADPLEAVQQKPVNLGQFVQTDTGPLMPFTEYEARVQQAYADNPGVPREVVKNLMDDARLKYENTGLTTQGQIGRTTFQKFSPAMGKPIITKEDVQPVTRISVNNGTTGAPDEVQAWVAQLRAGNATLKDIPARGAIRTQVVNYLTQNYPDTDLAALAAGKKWTESTGATQTIALVDATKGILSEMKNAYLQLGRTNVPAVNWLQDKYQEYTGSTKRADFMSLKNYGVQEVEKTLSGSGAMSDHRIKLAFENLKNSSTGPQFVAATNALEKVLAERERATRQGPYPSAKTPIGGQQQQSSGQQIAPAGTQAKLANGKIVTSDGRGGWN